MNKIKIQKTKKTKIFYLKQANALLKQYKKDKNGISWRDNPIDAVKWLFKRTPKWSPATWRLNKACLLYFMEQYGPIEAVNLLKNANWTMLKKEYSAGMAYNKKELKTSQQKLKFLSNQDLIEIIEYLAKHNRKWDYLIAAWLLVGKQTGLRPSEWKTARLSEDNNKLIVQNAKYTNGRGCGKTRTIIITHMSEKDKKGIQDFITKIQFLLQEYSFDEIYTRCRVRLGWVTRQIWPNRKKYPTLYSARHQFSADLKKNGYTLIEIAALFGHASDATATKHYGKKNMGTTGSNGKRQIEASEENKQLVKHKVFNFPHRKSPSIVSNLVGNG